MHEDRVLSHPGVLTLRDGLARGKIRFKRLSDEVEARLDLDLDHEEVSCRMKGLTRIRYVRSPRIPLWYSLTRIAGFQ